MGSTKIICFKLLKCKKKKNFDLSNDSLCCREEFKIRGENDEEKLQYVAWSTAGNALVSCLPLLTENRLYLRHCKPVS